MQVAVPVGYRGQGTESSPVRKLDVEEVLAAFCTKLIGEDGKAADTVSTCNAFVALRDDVALPAIDRREFCLDNSSLDRLTGLVFDDG